jgi:hypothetical protein
VYYRESGQFVMVVEGVPGVSGIAPGSSLQPGILDNRPDLQIQNTRGMGANPTRDVCDTGSPPYGGGIPGIEQPSFEYDPDTLITDALNDFACRFEAFSPGSPCTSVDASGEAKTVVAGVSVQFCDLVAVTAAFPPGESVLSVKLRDRAGNTGPTAQIVVRVATPTPTP